MNIPFHRPNIPETLDKINTDSIKSGWLTTGAQVLKFEKNFQIIYYINMLLLLIHVQLDSI